MDSLYFVSINQVLRKKKKHLYDIYSYKYGQGVKHVIYIVNNIFFLFLLKRIFKCEVSRSPRQLILKSGVQTGLSLIYSVTFFSKVFTCVLCLARPTAEVNTALSPECNISLALWLVVDDKLRWSAGLKRLWCTARLLLIDDICCDDPLISLNKRIQKWNNNQKNPKRDFSFHERRKPKFYWGLVNQHVQYYSYCSAFLVIASNGLTESNFVVTVSIFFSFFFLNVFGSVFNFQFSEPLLFVVCYLVLLLLGFLEQFWSIWFLFLFCIHYL